MKKILLSATLATTFTIGSAILPQAQAESLETLERVGKEPTVDYAVTTVEEARKEIPTTEDKKRSKEIFAENDIKEVNFNDLPADTVVMDFENMADFEKFLEESKEPLEISLGGEEEVSGFASMFQMQSADAATRKTFKYSRTEGKFTHVNLYAAVTKASNGKISSVDVSTGLSGFTAFAEWDERSTSYRLSATKLSGIAYASGDFSLIANIAGVGAIWDKRINMELKFFASKI